MTCECPEGGDEQIWSPRHVPGPVLGAFHQLPKADLSLQPGQGF